jgi:hypothetical protein
MLETLRDPIWQFIGAVLAFIAAILTVVFFLAQRQNKALSYIVVANTRLLTVAKEIRPRVQILLDGQPVETAHYVLVKLINSGSAPIIPADYTTPVSIDIGDGVQILSLEVVETDPPGLNAVVSSKDNIISIEPLLLNKSDSISIKALTNKAPVQPFVVAGRIVGVKRITRYLESYPYLYILQQMRSDKSFRLFWLLWVGLFLIT